MSELRKNIGDLLKIVHNPESVIEVSCDANKHEINEGTCLNYNRCTVYNYTLSEYQDCLVKYNINLTELA